MVRRSGRSTKQPDLFKPAALVTGEKRMSYADYGTSDDEGPGFVTAMRKRKSSSSGDKKGKTKSSAASKKAMAALRARRSATAEDDDVDHTSDESVDLSHEPFSHQLFETMKGGKQSAMMRLCNKWISAFQSNKVEATVHILNFVLRCAGTTKDWIGLDVDLDGMLPEDLDELLREMVVWMEANMVGGVYPISAVTKVQRANRVHFRKFWSLFASTLIKSMSSSVDGSSLDNDLGILHTVVEQLVSLSSTHVSHIRNVVTEAAMAVGKELVDGSRSINEQLATSQRLEKAEAKKDTSKGTNKQRTPKHTALVKQIEILGDAAESIESLYNDIFAAVFVHRSSDADEQIRALSVRSLLSWLVIYPAKLWKSDKLQYVGNILHDKSAMVRKECLQVLDMILVEYDEETIEALEEQGVVQAFMDDFGERLVDMCYDSDNVVSRKTLELLCKAQEPSRALLDSMDSSLLDRVDRIIFDPEAPLKLRQLAVDFMMDHTEGFSGEPVESDDDDEDDVAPSKKKSKKGGKKSKAEMRALERRRETAQQLETLTEFVQMHKDNESPLGMRQEGRGGAGHSTDAGPLCATRGEVRNRFHAC